MGTTQNQQPKHDAQFTSADSVLERLDSRSVVDADLSASFVEPDVADDSFTVVEDSSLDSHSGVYGDVPGLVRMSAEEFAETRRVLGFSKTRMADELNVRFSTVTRWESGEFSVPYGLPDELHALAESQLVALQDFFGL